MLSPVFGRYRIKLTRRQWRLGTGSSLLGGNGDLGPGQAYSEAMAIRWIQQELPVRKLGHRSKLTRKWTTQKTRMATRQENPGSARTRFDQDPVHDSKPPEDSRSCARDAKTRDDACQSPRRKSVAPGRVWDQPEE